MASVIFCTLIAVIARTDHKNMFTAKSRIARVRSTSFAIITRQRRAFARRFAIDCRALVSGCAQIAIAAAHADFGRVDAAADFGVAGIGRAAVIVVTRRLAQTDAFTRKTRIAKRTCVAIVASRDVVKMFASPASGRIAVVIRAWICVITSG